MAGRVLAARRTSLAKKVFQDDRHVWMRPWTLRCSPR